MINPKVSLLILLLLGAPVFAASLDDQLRLLETTDDEQVALKLVKQLEPAAPGWSALDQGRYLVRLGVVQEDILRDITSAGNTFNRAITLLESLPNPSQPLADAYYERAYVKYIRTHNTSLYCPDREKAVALTRQLNSRERLPKYLASLAFCYTDRADRFQQGLALLNEAMKLAETENLPADERGMIYNATSLLYRKNQLYRQAYDYSMLAYEQWKSANNLGSMDNQQHNLLIDAINMGDLERAEEHGRQLFKLADESPNNKDFRFFALYDSGSVALAKKDFVRAIKLFEQARAEEKNTEETSFIAMNRAQLAMAYFMNGDTGLSLQEAGIVKKMPGYASMETDKQQAVEALLQFQNHDTAQALHTLFNLVDSEQQLRREFLKNASLDYAARHDSRIQQFEKQLLENKLQIQQLQLNAQQREHETSRWYLLLSTIAVISLLLLVYTLLRSRGRFRRLAQTDALTGIANRRHFLECTHRMMKRFKDHDMPVSVLMLDVDHFKHINDTYGHQAGDAAIKHVVINMLACLRNGDLLGRTGGEEFAAILPDTDADTAWLMSENIRSKIERTPLNYHGDQIHITISIGLATSRLHLQDADHLLQKADQAMYRAKAAGRNQSHSFASIAENVTDKAVASY